MTAEAGILLDTHTWLWLATGDEKLPVRIRQTLEKREASGRLFVAAITLLEIANLSRRGRVTLPMPLEEWLTRALSEVSIGLVPLSPRIAAETALLPEEFQGDPADRLIVATARAEGLTLCTRDKQILRHAKKGLFRALPF